MPEMLQTGRFRCYPKILHLVLLSILLGTLVYVFSINKYFSKVDVQSKAVAPEGLRIKGKNFTFRKKPFRILSGSLHYFRVPFSDWEDRLLKMKSMGLNTVDIYIPWNLHEPVPGQFTFKDNLDIGSFLRVVAAYDMWAIVRPGPYICSEWDLGGLPSWLLRDEKMKLRSTYPPFMSAVTRYFNKLLPLIVPYQFSHGGPIIAFQIENEYGVYGEDIEYLKGLKELYEDNKLSEMFFVCDNEDGLGKYKLDGVLQTINFMSKNSKRMMDKLLEFQPDKPIFVTEFWDGWFNHWGEKYHKVDEHKLANTLKEMLQRGASFNLYMWHGGTNFGFMNGANANDDGSNYQCDITSYDYDAPVSETGILRSKFETLKDVIKKHSPPGIVPKMLPWIPDHGGYTAYGDIEFSSYIPLEDIKTKNLISAISRRNPCSMEMLPINNNAGQSYGYVLYESEVRQPGTSLMISKVKDFAVVLINGQMVYTSSSKFEPNIKVNVDGHFKSGAVNTIQILVENSGRVNYGKDINNQRKGILGKVELDNNLISNWKIYPLEFHSDWITKLSKDKSAWNTFDTKGKKKTSQTKVPTIYRGNMFVHSFPRDTILQLPGWFKGVVFVNGHNIGRYWNIGPQKTLFVPNMWLFRKDNTVILFDLHGTPTVTRDYPTIESTYEHDLGEKDAVEFLL